MNLPPQEDRLTLARLARLVPRDNRRGHASASALRRWCRTGVRGVCLEHERGANGAYLSTREALARFHEALAARERTPAQIEWTLELIDRAAEEACRRVGI